MRFIQKSAVFLLLVSLFFGTVAGVSDAADEIVKQNIETALQSRSSQTPVSYYDYYSAHSNDPRPQLSIRQYGVDFSSANDSNAEVFRKDGKSGVVLGTENLWSEWIFDVQGAGAYSLFLDYYALEGTGKDIEIGILIDGKSPFADAGSILLPRFWSDKDISRKMSKDAKGNDLRPTQIEVYKWTNESLRDSRGMYDEPYLFYLEAGAHAVRVVYKRESFAVGEIVLQNSAPLPTYQQYRSQFENAAVAKSETIRQEAEYPVLKNSSMLYPVNDRSSAATYPNDPYYLRLNTIGQNNWNAVGQSITWKADVQEDGLYKVSFRARQNYNQGMTSYRTLYINGEIPFKEAENIEFAYDSGWYVKTLGGSEPLLIYLKKGDELTLSCPPGKMSGVLRNINQGVLGLNAVYRKIIIITGASPDVYRDYALEREIPDLISLLKIERDRFSSISLDILSVTGESSSQTATLNQMAKMLNEFIANSYTITDRLSSFKSQIESVSSLLLSFSQQPLELDCLYFSAPETNLPDANASFIEDIMFLLKKFFASFSNDYNAVNIDKSSSDTVNVWVATGRDQTQIINSMINDSFMPSHDVNVNLSLVDTGATLIQATLAGKGPDVALMVNAQDVINFAMRDALVDLNSADYTLKKDLKDQFHESAWTPFYFKKGIYAVPETQVFNMLFYRTDIFEELKLSPPKTWTEFYNVLQVLQSSNLVVGINEIDEANQGVSAGISLFDSLLFQRGGTYYNQDLTETEFNTVAAFEAFEEWTLLYSEYKLPRSVNFFNRFRTGEMPVGIAGYTLYNQLMASAPELRGLWKMAEIPGTEQEDGTINHAASSGGTGVMMLGSAKKRNVDKAAYKFISWWTGCESQSRYGKELESILGVAARYNPANKLAFEQLGWTVEEMSVLGNQWFWVKNINQIPGNYMLARALTNAFRSSVENNSDPKRSLFLYNRDINAELKRKRMEFNLD